jgi:xanthine dehydrogenase accessory factor
VARILEALARTAGFPTAWVAPDADGAEWELGVLERLAPGAFVFIASEGGRPYDEETLYLALRAGARYVGLLASRQRAALLIASMLRRGVPLDEIRKRLRSPMGLDIGAKTAGEIAVSALAEAVMELRGGTGRPLSEVKNPYALLQEALSGNISHRCPPKTEAAGDLHTPTPEGNK